MAYLQMDEEQALNVKRMAAEPTRAALLAGDTGVGKTLMGVELIKALGTEVNLIVAPPNTMKQWRQAAEDQGVRLPFHVIDSAHKQFFEALKNHVPGIYFVSRQFFALSGTDLDPEPIRVKGQPKLHWYLGDKRLEKDPKRPAVALIPFMGKITERYYIGDQRVWLDKKGKAFKVGADGELEMTKGRKALWYWSEVSPGLTIYDEVQAVNNRYSQGFTALKSIRTGYRLAASGTPQGNKFKGIWSVCRWLWPTATNDQGDLYVDVSQWRWAAEWGIVKPDLYAGKKITGERIPGAFVSSLPCYVRMEAERTPVEVRKCYVNLTDRQRSMYDQMEEDALVWLDEHPLIADLPIVQRIRLRQITLGEVTFNDAGEVDFSENCESSKIDALHKVLDKHHPGEPVFILTDSSKFARVVAKRLGPLAREWSGRTSAKQRDEIKAAFGDTVRYIVAVIPAVAEGLDGLQRVCNVEVWLSESLNGMLNEQAEGRLNRRGQEAEVIYSYKIMARNTDDDEHFANLVSQRVNNKASLRKGN